MILHFLGAFFASLLAALLNALISWLLLFRSESFREQIANLEKKRKQLEELREKNDDEKDRTTAKRIKRLEDDIGVITKEVTGKNLRFNVVSGLFLFVMNRVFRSAFEGIIVARIPFEPFGFVTRITHAGIENEDMRDASFQFVYWLGSLLFRDVLNKLFGFEVPQLGMGLTQNAFAMPQR